MSRDDYAFPCAGCLCDHCANNLYSSDQMAGEAKIFCYVCEECRYYDGDLKNKDMRCKQCENYIVTNEHAERLRKKIKVIKRNAYGMRNFENFRARILHVMNS